MKRKDRQAAKRQAKLIMKVLDKQELLNAALDQAGNFQYYLKIMTEAFGEKWEKPTLDLHAYLIHSQVAQLSLEQIKAARKKWFKLGVEDGKREVALRTQKP